MVGVTDRLLEPVKPLARKNVFSLLMTELTYALLRSREARPSTNSWIRASALFLGRRTSSSGEKPDHSQKALRWFRYFSLELSLLVYLARWFRSLCTLAWPLVHAPRPVLSCIPKKTSKPRRGCGARRSSLPNARALWACGEGFIPLLVIEAPL